MRIFFCLPFFFAFAFSITEEEFAKKAFDKLTDKLVFLGKENINNSIDRLSRQMHGLDRKKTLNILSELLEDGMEDPGMIKKYKQEVINKLKIAAALTTVSMGLTYLLYKLSIYEQDSMSNIIEDLFDTYGIITLESSNQGVRWLIPVGLSKEDQSAIRGRLIGLPMSVDTSQKSLLFSVIFFIGSTIGSSVTVVLLDELWNSKENCQKRLSIIKENVDFMYRII